MSRGGNYGKRIRWILDLLVALPPPSCLAYGRGAGYGVSGPYPPWARVAGSASWPSQHTSGREVAGVNLLGALHMNATGNVAIISTTSNTAAARNLFRDHYGPISQFGLHTRPDYRWRELFGAGARPAPDKYGYGDRPVW